MLRTNCTRLRLRNCFLFSSTSFRTYPTFFETSCTTTLRVLLSLAHAFAMMNPFLFLNVVLWSVSLVEDQGLHHRHRFLSQHRRLGMPLNVVADVGPDSNEDLLMLLFWEGRVRHRLRYQCRWISIPNHPLPWKMPLANPNNTESGGEDVDLLFSLLRLWMRKVLSLRHESAHACDSRALRVKWKWRRLPTSVISNDNTDTGPLSAKKKEPIFSFDLRSLLFVPTPYTFAFRRIGSFDLASPYTFAFRLAKA